MEYASLRGSLDGMDPSAITEIADYFQREIGYTIPPMTPFVGKNFNVTRAGIHADGLMKDEEIYTIFDTKKILNRPATVQISKTSGLAGIAYWLNQNFRLKGDDQVQKHDPLVITMKDWIDQEYEDGRQTVMTDKELDAMVERLAPGRFKKV
jgi:isopropylmalate/homocitrate/citramalate synthase